MDILEFIANDKKYNVGIENQYQIFSKMLKRIDTPDGYEIGDCLEKELLKNSKDGYTIVLSDIERDFVERNNAYKPIWEKLAVVGHFYGEASTPSPVAYRLLAYTEEAKKVLEQIEFKHLYAIQ